ncbi:MAG: agmatine deiminase family protein [Muribaculaceae bacterium]|nr:agmatine deiminase family protein [Muribaculaceae bacterium]
MSTTRFLAEWEPQEGVLMALPDADTDWSYILSEARDQYLRLIEAFTTHGLHVLLLCHNKEEALVTLRGLDLSGVTLMQADYNDTWTRDYGPLQVERNDRRRNLDFGFNGWGLKFASDKDNLVNLSLKKEYAMLPETYRNERDFVLEGGSVETDGHGTILTTTRCLTSPNRNGGKSKPEINSILADCLGADHVLWLDYGALAGDDTDSHIDTLARMAPGDTILFTGCRNFDDEHFEELLRMRAQLTLFRTSDGNPYNLIELPLPNPVFDYEGNRLPATYANYLVSNEAVFMPTYAQPANDTLAANTLKVAFPGHDIVGIDCRTLLFQHGSLHCATMQLHNGFFNPAILEKQ